MTMVSIYYVITFTISHGFIDIRVVFFWLICLLKPIARSPHKNRPITLTTSFIPIHTPYFVSIVLSNQTHSICCSIKR
jgi:hypothetical protein